jgi:acetylornithine aminotransferase/acetylornithine/N-succinyldiaminopimelate aminotransferase
VTEHEVVPFGDLDAVRAKAGAETAAILIEPVQSMAGARVADAACYHGLRAVADEVGALLIFDEVQTAPGRTGRAFAGDHWDVTPDVITTAKGIASGVPCAVALVRGDVASDVGYGEQGTTFGGGMIAMAAMEATLAVVVDEDLPGNAARRREQIETEALAIPGIEAVHGLGLLVGLRVTGGAKRVTSALFERRVLASTSPGDPDVVRLLPPLTLTEDDAGAFLDALRSAMVTG